MALAQMHCNNDFMTMTIEINLVKYYLIIVCCFTTIYPGPR